eukprot:9376580-Karenia_brevis.AAC.1
MDLSLSHSSKSGRPLPHPGTMQLQSRCSFGRKLAWTGSHSFLTPSPDILPPVASRVLFTSSGWAFLQWFCNVYCSQFFFAPA